MQPYNISSSANARVAHLVSLQFTAIVPAAASRSGLEYLELEAEATALSCGIEQGSRLSYRRGISIFSTNADEP